MMEWFKKPKTAFFTFVACAVIFTGCSGATSSDLAAITGVPDTGSVTVISGGGGSATPTPTPAPGAAATIVLVSGNLQDVPVNTQASSSLIVLIRDASNQPIASEAVTFLVSGHGSVSSILTTTNASGLASVNFTADGSAGAAIVTATSAQGSVVFNLNVVALSSYTMQIVSGNNTTDAIGAAISPLKVRVLNGSGAPASLVSVTYTIQTGNGNFSGASSRVVLTDSNGYAESTFNLGTTGGSNTIKAALTSSAGVFATFTETGTVPSTSVVDLAQSTIELSQNSSQANGSNLVTVTVKVRDQYQNLIPNSSQPVTVTFSPSVGAWVSASTLNYASTGTYTNTYRVGSSATTVVFTAFYGVASFTSGTASLILNTGLVTGAQGATLSLVAGNSQTVQISQTASAALKVLALDSLGIPISGSSVTFTVVTAGGGTLTGGLSSATVTTGVDGTAEVNFTAGSSAGSVSISANSVQGTVGFSLTVQDLTGYTIEKINSLQTDNQTALLNARLAQDVSVRVLNAGGTPVQGMLVRFQCQSVNCGQFTNGQNSIDVATNSSGISSAGYYVGTAPGVYTVRAIIPPQAGIFTDFTETATVDPASSVSLLNTTVALSSSSVTADGNQTVTVTVALKDSYGNVIPNDSNSVVVTPSPSSLGAWSGGSFVGSSGVYTRTYSIGSTAGSISFSGTVNGSALLSTAPTLTLTASSVVVPANTAITALNASVTADGASTSTIVVTLKDTFGNQISNSSHTVVLSTTAGTLGSVFYHSATGTYRAVFTAPVSAGVGSAVVSVTSVNGTGVAGKSTTLTLVPGTLSTTLSTFTVPTRVLSALSSAQTLTVTLVDSNSNPVTSASSVVITKTTSGGVSGGTFGTLANSGTATHLGSGVYTVTLTSPASLTNCTVVSPCIDTLTATATIAGTPSVIGSATRVAYAPYAAVVPTAGNSTFTLSTTTSAAGLGQSSIIATVTLKNSSNQAFPVGGFGSSLTATTAFSTPSISKTDNGDGTYTFVIPSPATSASGLLSIQYGGTNISGSTTTIYFFGAPDPTNSTFALSKSTFNGPDTATITLTVRDSNNFVIPTCTIPNFTTANVEFTENGNTTLTGSVACNVVSGAAQFSQVIARAEPPAIGFETVTVGARFFLSSAWQNLAATSTLTINPPNLQGITIDCSNIATYQNTHLYVTAGTLTINSWQDGSPLTCGSSTPFTFASVTVGANGIITHSASTTSISYGMDFVSTGNVTIAASGAISAEGKGYLNNRIYPNVSYTISGGGSHGGSGTAGTNATYGSVSDPNTLGAGGYQGSGGGLIRIQAANIVNQGLISARALWNSIGSNLTGAGGSIKLTVSGTLTGTGLINAAGGTGSVAGSKGGGGRVAIYGDASGFPFGNINVAGGNTDVTYLIYPSISGSLYMDHVPSAQVTPFNSFTVDGTSSGSVIPFDSTNTITIPNGVTFTMGSSAVSLADIIVNFGGTLLTNGAITVSNVTVNGTISHPVRSLTYTSPKVDITASGNIVVSTTGTIHANGKGFPGGNQGYNVVSPDTEGARGAATTGAGIFVGAGMNAVSLIGKSGNHFTVGGSNDTGVTWGDSSNPNTYGGGGGRGNNSYGGTGGGIVRLTANTITLDSTISANGASGSAFFSSFSGGCGAGGSVYLNAQTISSPLNIAVVQAIGGSIGTTGTSTGGAGGLVKIQGTTSGTITKSVAGGTGGSAPYNGAAGVLTIAP